MVNVGDVARELAIKIGDKVSGDGDGTIFWSEDRMRYISRAYGKLMRILSMAMRKYKPDFVLPLVPINKKFKDPAFSNPVSFEGVKLVDVKELIVTLPGTAGKAIASRLDPANYNQTRFGLNEINKPDVTKKSIFYSLIDSEIYILPDNGKYTEADVMAVVDLPDTLTVEDDLPIDKVYADLLITLAAIEAMNDLPHPQKVGLYRQELLDQVSVITAYTNLMERREGETGNG